MTTADQMNRYAELPLTVESEIGKVMLPMRDVLALAPGSVIRLPVRFGSHVRLLVGGAPFAAGEVVRIGKTPAVRLMSFARSSASGTAASGKASND